MALINTSSNRIDYLDKIHREIKRWWRTKPVKWAFVNKDWVKADRILTSDDIYQHKSGMPIQISDTEKDQRLALNLLVVRLFNTGTAYITFKFEDGLSKTRVNLGRINAVKAINGFVRNKNYLLTLDPQLLQPCKVANCDEFHYNHIKVALEAAKLAFSTG